MSSTIKLFDETDDEELADLSAEAPEGYEGVTGFLPGAKGQDRVHQDGGLVFTVPYDHWAIDELTVGRIVRLISPEGTPVADGLIGPDSRQLVGDHEDLLVTFTCPGTLSAWRDAPLEPFNPGRPVTAVIKYDWGSPVLDTGDWSDTVYAQTWSESQYPHPPDCWPVAEGQDDWILSRPEVAVQPVGITYYRRSRLISTPFTAGLFVSGNSTYIVKVNGGEIDREPNKQPDVAGYEDFSRYIFDVTPGTLRVAIGLINWGPGPGESSDNPAGLRCALGRIVANKVVEWLWLTTEDDEWICIDFDEDTPGHTGPEVLADQLDKIQARDELLGWSLVVHGTHPIIPEVPAEVGKSLHDLLDALQATWLDYRPDHASLTLNLYPKGEAGTDRSASIDLVEAEAPDDVADIVVLEDKSDGVYYNALQLRTPEGVEWYENEASTRPRRSGAFTVGTFESASTRAQIANRWLTTFADPVRAVSATTAGNEGKRLGEDFDVADLVTLRGQVAEVVGGTYTVDELGELDRQADFNSLGQLRREEQLRAINTITAQLKLAGASQILQPQLRIPAGSPERLEWDWSWNDTLTKALLTFVSEGESWQVKRLPRSMRLGHIDLEIPPGKGVAAGTTTIEVMKNGGAMGAIYRCTIGAAEVRDQKRLGVAPEVYGDQGDLISIRVVANGDHRDGRFTMRWVDAP